MLTVTQAAGAWNVSPSQVKKWANAHEIDAVKVGREWKITPGQTPPDRKPTKAPRASVDPVYVPPDMWTWMKEQAEAGNEEMKKRIAFAKGDPRYAHLFQGEDEGNENSGTV